MESRITLHHRRIDLSEGEIDLYLHAWIRRLTLNIENPEAIQFGDYNRQLALSPGVEYSADSESKGVHCIVAWKENPPTEILEGLLALKSDEAYLEGLSKGSFRRRGPSIQPIDDNRWIGMPTQQLEPEVNLSAAAREWRDEQIEAVFAWTRRALRWIAWRSAYVPDFEWGEQKLYWSTDAREYLELPFPALSQMEFGQDLVISTDLVPAFAETPEADRAEPFGHELFRDAWKLRYRNARSSLVLGAAAAEVGFKYWAALMAPDAKWILEKLQTPALNDMLTGYLPELLNSKLKVSFDGKIARQGFVKVIQDGIDARNKLVHSAPTRTEYVKVQSYLVNGPAERLTPFLLAVSDMLWLLDYYLLRFQGLDANRPLSQVRPETLEEWRQIEESIGTPQTVERQKEAL